jgi:hypothetical protein
MIFHKGLMKFSYIFPVNLKDISYSIVYENELN